MKLVNELPTGTVGVGSAMPTSTVPSAVKPAKPKLATVNPDTLERQQKNKAPKVVPPKPPTRKITVPALDQNERQKVEDLDEAVYNARGAERGGTRTVVGGGAAATFRNARLRAASMLGNITPPGTVIGANAEQWRAGWAKGDSWRNSITTMSMLEKYWTDGIASKSIRFGVTGLTGMIATQGKLNLLAPITDPLFDLYRGNKAAAIKGGISNAAMQLFMYGMVGAAVEGQYDEIAAVLKANGVPDEYLDGATKAYIEAAKGPTYVNSQVAGTINDAQIIGLSTAAGAILAPMTGGASLVAGIGIGWGLGTLIAGANNVLAMFSGNTAPNLYSVIPYNAYEDENFMTASFLTSETNKAVANYLAEQDPNRFIPYDEANKWIVQYYSNNTPIEGDPRNGEVYDLIKQGYFIDKNWDGTYGIDHVAYQNYMIESALYKNEEDKKRYLPELSAAGREFAANDELLNTRDEWNGIWRNPAILQYEP